MSKLPVITAPAVSGARPDTLRVPGPDRVAEARSGRSAQIGEVLDDIRAVEVTVTVGLR